MSRGVNKVILLGYVGAEPETRYLPSGKAVSNLRVATSEQWKDKHGERQERTEWHSLVAFDKLGEIVEKYVKKGTQVYVEGKLQTRKWQDKEGKDRYSTEIVLDQLVMLGAGGSTGRQSEGDERPARREEPRGNSRQRPATPAKDEGDFDDDIPF